MKHEKFQQSSENFLMWLNTLVATTQSMIPQAKGMLEGDDPRPMDAEREQAAELALRGIGERIDDVMSSFDKMLVSIEMSPQYESYFRLGSK